LRCRHAAAAATFTATIAIALAAIARRTGAYDTTVAAAPPRSRANSANRRLVSATSAGSRFCAAFRGTSPGCPLAIQSGGATAKATTAAAAIANAAVATTAIAFVACDADQSCFYLCEWHCALICVTRSFAVLGV